MDKDLYCYKMMLFGLKNAGAIYQCLVNNVFKCEIDRNIEVYIDDMLVKSTEADRYIADLEEACGKLRQHQMKLNLNKYIFGVSLEKILGFMVA